MQADDLNKDNGKKVKDKAKKVLKECMENAMKLDIPLEVEISEGQSWYAVK